jgi:hypothetical protein
MPVKKDWRYLATVADACIKESTTKGTPGLFMEYSTDDGLIKHTWYISPNSRKKLAENLEACFGIDQNALSDWEFLDRLGEVLTGQTCDISTTEEEYDNKFRVIVSWMNPAGSGTPGPLGPKRVADSQKLRRIAGIFGGGPVSSPAYKPNALVPRDPAAPTTAPEFSEDVPF